ncbi:hypothetical protein [Fischerella sp. PCC 9605]|uniref:hypothetical protein n=1 Tax=Fischerella sp. PCC 9605 TaxID=1173024 RepID=UPI00047AA773|nr:hypothetical protein [Fischerella sp. PCC 9605]
MSRKILFKVCLPLVAVPLVSIFTTGGAIASLSNQQKFGWEPRFISTSHNSILISGWEDRYQLRDRYRENYQRRQEIDREIRRLDREDKDLQNRWYSDRDLQNRQRRQEIGREIRRLDRENKDLQNRSYSDWYLEHDRYYRNRNYDRRYPNRGLIIK